MERLENGLTKLENTSAQVDDLKVKLAVQEVELKQKNEDADQLIQVVGVETEKVSKEKVIANAEELKVQVIAKVCVCFLCLCVKRFVFHSRRLLGFRLLCSKGRKKRFIFN